MAGARATRIASNLFDSAPASAANVAHCLFETRLQPRCMLLRTSRSFSCLCRKLINRGSCFLRESFLRDCCCLYSLPGPPQQSALVMLARIEQPVFPQFWCAVCDGRCVRCVGTFPGGRPGASLLRGKKLLAWRQFQTNAFPHLTLHHTHRSKTLFLQMPALRRIWPN